MYYLLVTLFLITSCQKTMQKKNYLAFKVKSEKVVKKGLRIPQMGQEYKVFVENFPKNESYKVLWYTEDSKQKDVKYSKTGETFSYMMGDANPGPNAVYGDMNVYAEVEYPDGSKSNRIKVFTYRYLIRPGFGNDFKEKRLTE